MATGSATTGAPLRRAPEQHELVEYERFIDRELSKTARQVRGIDIMSGLMGWLAVALVYLMLAAAADHWLFAGGLGSGGRWLALLGLLFGSGWFLGRRVAPLILHRINPVYSAHTIERGRPQLKNSLVNFLLLRREERELPEVVRDALQAQAASGLAATPVEQTLDRTPLVRFALVLLGAVVLAALYIMLSPKDPLRSAARVILPWASIDRPTRFKIEHLQVEVVETGRKFTGGPAEAFYGQKVKITASVTNRGRVASEPIVLRFTTADGTAENQALTLEARERSADIILPAGTLAAAVGGGLQQSLDYTLTAGDAVAGPYRITVLAAPTIEIESLEYDYPDYTRLPNRTLQGQGDISALEGTRVIVRAKANQEIGQAWLDLGCDGRRDATMQAEGRGAGVNFVVALQEDRRTPTHPNYLIRFKNQDGFENPQPIRYRIDVTPDLAPEINWEAPREVDVPRELPVDETIELVFSAGDRDFDLAKVTLRAAVDTEKPAEQRPWEKALLDKPRADKWQSESVRFVPGEHGFRAGETILVWGEAADNRQPKPNLVETPKLKVKLLPPRDPAEKQGPNHRPNDGSGEQQSPANGQQEPQGKGEPQNREQQPGEEAGGKQNEQDGEQGQQGAPQSKQNGEKQNGDKPEQGEKSEQGREGNQGQEQSPDGQRGGTGDEQQQQGGEGDQSSDQSQPGGKNSSSGGGQQDGQRGKGAGNESHDDQARGGDSDPQNPSRSGHASGEKTGREQAVNDEGGEPGGNQPARRVDPDAQDGDAFERMKEYFDQQEKNGDEQQPSGDPQDGQPKPNGEKSGSADQSSDGEPKQGAKQGGQDNKRQPEQGAAKPGEKSEQDPADGASAERQAASDEDAQPTDQPAADQAGGARNKPGDQGAQQRTGEDQPRNEHTAAEPQDQQAEGNNHPSVDNQSKAGAGQKGQEESTGTPEAQGQNRQRDKGGKQSDQQQPKDEQAPQSPSQSQQHSDSEGGEEGDESGGGEEGGGQNADRQGTGSAGSNTEADDGSGAGQESGDGETDGRGGDDRQAQSPTDDANAKAAKGQGKQGDDGEQSPNSRQGKGSGHKQPAGDKAAKDKQNQQPGDNQHSSSAGGEGAPNGAKQTNPSQQDSSHEPGGGGQGGDNPPPPKPPAPQGEPGGDEANRDYAERATDLVLNKLKDQLKKGEPDEALLEKLQWTKQDLERFVKRWEQMKSAARQPGAQGQKAKHDLDEALKSLGLRPRGTTVRAGQSRQDQVRGNRDSRQSEPPPEYAEQYRQFNVGTSKGE